MHKESSQTCYKLELRNRILKAAMTEFLHKGVKSVKMDDIANALAISKRRCVRFTLTKRNFCLRRCVFMRRSSTTTWCSIARTRIIV